ncbi:hypothetical protein B0T21DRAFT_351178 [Apiosordaria backusii]|uniref:Uncharacterized protein n=1 Tax=Apiosordaria backusii TaxID=314023 RepID=A0AA40ASI7_9PEZI|nr:hypothetical protein B0T21DRAFT_351178 [Apiosordaria backusii]
MVSEFPDSTSITASTTFRILTALQASSFEIAIAVTMGVIAPAAIAAWYFWSTRRAEQDEPRLPMYEARGLSDDGSYTTAAAPWTKSTSSSSGSSGTNSNITRPPRAHLHMRAPILGTTLREISWLSALPANNQRRRAPPSEGHSSRKKSSQKSSSQKKPSQSKPSQQKSFHKGPSPHKSVDNRTCQDASRQSSSYQTSRQSSSHQGSSRQSSAHRAPSHRSSSHQASSRQNSSHGSSSHQRSSNQGSSRRRSAADESSSRHNHTSSSRRAGTWNDDDTTLVESSMNGFPMIACER